MRGSFLRSAFALIGSAAVLTGAGFFSLRGSWPWKVEPVRPVTVQELFSQTQDTLRRGETLSQLFIRNGFNGFQMSPSATAGIFEPRRLRPGLVFSFLRRTTDTIPTKVVVRLGPEQRVALHLVNDGWWPEAEPVMWRAEPVTLSGRITTSLYDALDEEVSDSLLSLPDRIRLAWDLADIFAWQVDFSRDIRPGDHFRVLAERLISEEGEVRYGRVLAGDLAIGGASYDAYRFPGLDGTSSFYDGQGRSLRRAFLLAPVSFRRISSGFNRARLHPILGIVRKHEGMDFAADPGTPVMAAGDGVVTRDEWTGGYGNLVEIRHANGIVTRYGHLRDYAEGLSVGKHVSQGDVIGHVGSTGLATGPHLHYEFRVNGVSVDPHSADLGTGDPVPADRLRDFERERARLDAQLLWPEGPVPALAGSFTAPASSSAIN
ncbi:MAG TPA: peptidoglycan DD-metalloendopeptidase family protein [Gemmatimonadales bacterium]|nr:peptidoglycan DD-metalloendopeptidase family protein [Gemmatimonadales bacterium]